MDGPSLGVDIVIPETVGVLHHPSSDPGRYPCRPDVRHLFSEVFWGPDGRWGYRGPEEDRDVLLLTRLDPVPVPETKTEDTEERCPFLNRGDQCPLKGAEGGHVDGTRRRRVGVVHHLHLWTRPEESVDGAVGRRKGGDPDTCASTSSKRGRDWGGGGRKGGEGRWVGRGSHRHRGSVGRLERV